MKSSRAVTSLRACLLVYLENQLQNKMPILYAGFGWGRIKFLHSNTDMGLRSGFVTKTV